MLKNLYLWWTVYTRQSGEDKIPPEVLKRCELDEEILHFCNRAFIEGCKPEQWLINNIIPIPKSGNLFKGANYRGISLCSLVAKTYNRMIRNRIRSVIEPIIRINQNGFRSGTTTTIQILALRRIIEGVKDINLPVIILFIDFKNAFAGAPNDLIFLYNRQTSVLIFLATS